MAAASACRAKEARSREPFAVIRRRAVRTAAPPPLALHASRFDLIAEIKLRAPSARGLGAATPATPELIATRAAHYAEAGAAAVSVLTEPDRFSGHLDHLAAASRVCDVPTIRKDFLVDPYQMFEARACGAGGALLILRMLDDSRLREMIGAAEEAGLFVLLEAFDALDLARVASLTDRHRARRGGPCVLVGLNCRDLTTLGVDSSRFVIPATSFPAGVARVAESGIETPDDAARVAALGYDMALVGGVLMRAADPRAAVRGLIEAGRAARHNPGGDFMRIRVKVCGINEPGTAEAAVASGADALGFVLSESPRRVTPRQAAALNALVPAHVARVAVLRRPDENELREALGACAFDCVQADVECAAAVAAVTHAPFLPVFHDGPQLAGAVRDWIRSPRRGAGVILVDGAMSGSGRPADWDRVAAIAGETRVVLAGGLTPGNVGDAIRRVRPWGVDVSSGVESAPGLKDSSRIAAFVESVRAAENRDLMEEHR